MNTSINGLARNLVEAGLFSGEVAHNVMQAALSHRTTFIRECIENQLVDADRLAFSISCVFGLPLVDIRHCRPLISPLLVVRKELLKKHWVLPLAIRDSRLVLAVSDPSQTPAIREIEFCSGKSADLVIASHNHLAEAVLRLVEGTESKSLGQIRVHSMNLGSSTLPPQQDKSEFSSAEDVDGPVVRAVNRLLLDAVAQRASDIHIEPYEKNCRVRIRVDGLLREFASPPIHIAGRLTARLKIMAKLDISERRLPQDGRIRIRRSNSHVVDFRVSTIPTLWGEKTVLRVLDPLRTQLDLSELGLSEQQLLLFDTALGRPQGLILVTGPTGSGKTVTLYSALSKLNDCSRNISTAEDPVEINLPGINQVQVNPAIGLSFADVLKSFLRQDPDVIMVGEIRDRETVDIAMKAAQTGHLVLSTLHTNSASDTLTRLQNMGVEPYNLVSSLSLVVAQRLARKLCDHCKRPAANPGELLRQYQLDSTQLPRDVQFLEASGCDRCHEGYRGRIGIYEVVPISAPLSRTIIAGGNSMEIAEQARTAGYPSLRQAALLKVAAGLTSLEEVNRVT